MVRVRRHHYQPSGQTDWRGRSAGCTQCPLPPDNEIHQVPEVDQAVVDAERRRSGDH